MTCSGCGLGLTEIHLHGHKPGCHFDGGRIAQLHAIANEPHAGLVELLERLLAEAKAGDLQSIVAVVETRESFSCHVAGDRQALQQLGALTYAQSVILGGME